VTDEARPAGPDPHEPVEGHCAWCDRPIPPNSPSTWFDSPEHQGYWHERHNGRDLPGHAPMIRNEHGMYTFPDVRAEGPPPHFLGSYLPDNSGSHYTGPSTPKSNSASTPPGGRQLDEGYEYAPPEHPGGRLTVVKRERRRGMNGCPPQQTAMPDGIGHPIVDGAYSIEEIEPEPERRTVYPADAVNRLRGLGWHVIDNGVGLDYPIRPVWRCARCLVYDTPQVHVGPYPYVDSGELVRFTMATKVICGHCRMPYLGPTVVPLWREVPGGGVDIAAVRGDHTVSYGWTLHHLRLPADVVRERSRDMSRDLWRDVRRGVSPGYPCSIPQCGKGPAQTWYLLGARLVLAGFTWNPEDNTPLRLGLCEYHTMRLRYLVVNDRETIDRMVVPQRPPETLSKRRRIRLPRLRIR
jgi:hypothetical protein